jgi:hypothetical protein
VYLAADNPPAEAAATLHHELIHVFLGDFGKSLVKGLHMYPGVTPQTNAAQDEAKENFGKK